MPQNLINGVVETDYVTVGTLFYGRDFSLFEFESSNNHFVLYIDLYWLRRHILSPYMEQNLTHKVQY